MHIESIFKVNSNRSWVENSLVSHPGGFVVLETAGHDGFFVFSTRPTRCEHPCDYIFQAYGSAWHGPLASGCTLDCSRHTQVLVFALLSSVLASRCFYYDWRGSGRIFYIHHGGHTMRAPPGLYLHAVGLQSLGQPSNSASTWSPDQSTSDILCSWLSAHFSKMMINYMYIVVYIMWFLLEKWH